MKDVHRVILIAAVTIAFIVCFEVYMNNLYDQNIKAICEYQLKNGGFENSNCFRVLNP